MLLQLVLLGYKEYIVIMNSMVTKVVPTGVDYAEIVDDGVWFRKEVFKSNDLNTILN